jgi:hypothetical protein
MYTIGAIEDNSDSHYVFLGIKYRNSYRYYALVYILRYAYTISLISGSGQILDHFINYNIERDISDIVLELCSDYDKFWYPELFETTS